MEEIWINFAIQLEKCEEHCFDAFHKLESKNFPKSSLDDLFTSVLTIVIKKKYHHLIVSKSEVIQGQNTIT